MQQLPASCISQADDLHIHCLNSPLLSYFYHKEKESQYRIVRDASNAVAASALSPGPDYIHYGHALTRWKNLLFSSPRPRASRILRQNLAGEHVFTILKEWWFNASFDTNKTLAVREWIQQAAVLQISLDILPRIPSPYDYFCFMLWYFEMNGSIRNDSLLVLRRGIGSTASIQSAIHRLVHHALGNRTKQVADEASVSDTLNNSEPSFRSLEFPTPTAAVDPCFWIQEFHSLRTVQEDVKSPQFLWDTSRDRTTWTRVLPDQELQYVAISHTWGRWTTGATYDSLDVPWPVPENSVFDVGNLPRMLKAANFPTRYVWLDLLCIPQEHAPAELKALGKVEIANQAIIFRSAVFSCAWLNNVPSWRGLTSAIKWLSLQHAERYSSMEVPEQAYKDIKREAWGARTFLLDPPTPMTSTAGTPTRWFTSLWTLQELCMCPNMLLYDFSWRPLEVNGFAVPFDHIVALFSSYPQGYVPFIPSTVTEVYNLLDAVGLGGNGFLRISPISLLILGNQRYCQERRAEAIMSVIGATSWFLEDPDSSEERLILGRYPLVFLNEIKRIFGASFFCWHDIFADQMNDNGTMLPFSDKLIGNRRTPILARSFDHRTVSSWTILPDGGVSVLNAVILASFPRRPRQRDFRAEMRIPASLEGYRRVPNAEVAVHDYLAQNGEGKEKHVVGLLQTDGAVFYGLLLERQNEGSFRKIGLCHWIMTEPNGHASCYQPNIFTHSGEQVDWVVQ